MNSVKTNSMFAPVSGKVGEWESEKTHPAPLSLTHLLTSSLSLLSGT